MASKRGARPPRLLRRARQRQGGQRLPVPGDPALAPRAPASQPAQQPELEAHVPPRATIAPTSPDHPPLARRAIPRPYPSQEPSELKLTPGSVRGAGRTLKSKGPSLPRPRGQPTRAVYGSPPSTLTSLRPV